MFKKKKRISYYPNTFLLINKKTYRAMNTKLRNIYKDFNLFLKLDTKVTDKQIFQNKSSSSILLKIKDREKKEQQKNLLRNKNDSSFTNITNKPSENKFSVIYNEKTPNKEHKIIYPKISAIKDLKLNFIKKITNNPITSRYIKCDVFQKEFLSQNYNSRLKKESHIIDSSQNNNENKNTTKNSVDISKIKKIKILDKSKRVKKIFIKKSKKLLEEILSIEKESEKEKEKELAEKEKYQSELKFKLLHHNNSMIIKSKFPIDEKFEIQCHKNASSYQKKIGLFYSEQSKKGLYTGHFFTILKKDKIFTQNIIQKMFKYSFK